VLDASRMADFVIDENHARRTGLSTFAVCRMSLKISSPSRPGVAGVDEGVDVLCGASRRAGS